MLLLIPAIACATFVPTDWMPADLQGVADYVRSLRSRLCHKRSHKHDAFQYFYMDPQESEDSEILAWVEIAQAEAEEQQNINRHTDEMNQWFENAWENDQGFVDKEVSRWVAEGIIEEQEERDRRMAEELQRQEEEQRRVLRTQRAKAERQYNQ